jgi:hypothetical protein
MAMPQNQIHPIFTLLLILICSGCETIQVLTAVDHKAEVETPESIRHFAKKKGIDGQPILRFDETIFSSDVDHLIKFQMYNREGQFLSLRDSAQGCPDKRQDYTAMKYILQKGDVHFRKDSISIKTGTLKDPEMEIDFKDLNQTRGDTSIWNYQTETYSTHLDNYVPFFRTLEGDVVDIYNLYPEYLVLYGYQMSGKSKFDCILIKEKKKEIKQLNKEFGPRIQLVLVNRDEMEIQPLNSSSQ